jgi:hypothetical protein
MGLLRKVRRRNNVPFTFLRPFLSLRPPGSNGGPSDATDLSSSSKIVENVGSRLKTNVKRHTALPIFLPEERSCHWRNCPEYLKIHGA